MKYNRKYLGAALRLMQRGSLYRHVMGFIIQKGLTIREADEADKLKVDLWINPKGYISKAGHQNQNVTEFVAYCFGYLAGRVQLVRYSSENKPYSGYWLWGLAVKSQFKGGGIGEKLSQEVILKASTEGSKTLDLLVFNNNVPALQLYRKLGFVHYVIPGLEEQLQAQPTQNGHRHVVMRKLIGHFQ